MKRSEVDYNSLSPMMKQYFDIKSKYEKELLFFRLGDFYELFFEDGITASHELELTLTGKNAGLEERIPMCGVPFHSVKPYIEKLIEKGYKVAICEQLEDPRYTKGMVKRGVIQVLSKGTLVDLEFLKEYDHNYIGSVLDFKSSYVFTYADISTGKMYTMMISHLEDKLINQILNLNIKEIIFENNDNIDLINTITNNYGIDISVSPDYLESDYDYLYKDIKELKLINGIKHLLYYLVVKELKDLSHIKNVIVVDPDNYLDMDIHTIRNLELVETLRLKERNNSLISLIDKTKTAMGSRLLKSWLLKPLKDESDIIERYDAIEILNNEFLLKDELRELLYNIYDIERLCGKVTCGNLNGRDLLQLKTSLKPLPRIIEIVDKLNFKLNLNNHDELYNILDKSISENPPLTIKEGYLIKDGYNKELDELKSIRSGGKEFISSLENSERERTGIKTLKVGFNKVFGYYIEVSKGQVSQIKEEWGFERRQTLADKERYITPLLKEKEALVLNAEEKIVDLEYDLFLEIKDLVKKEIILLEDTASELAKLDALISLSVIATDNSFVRPVINHEHNIEIVNGRHPVVEKVIKSEYVPNDCIMNSEVSTLLITGPNMSGKSTYMRQLAIIIILAQMGSYVPAKKASLPIFDKIFTRIGASDDLVSGESTFMVEMLEARNALVNATKNSLILFDELGRGTATYDGMSLAEAILEYVNLNIKCKTLFSTHYHELTELSNKIDSIKNIHVSAVENDGKLTFLHKIKEGAVDKSYGIHVAALAKLPDDVLKRAREILNYYENENTKTNKPVNEQLLFVFDEKKNNPLKEKIDTINPLEITPIEAINIIYELKQISKE